MVPQSCENSRRPCWRVENGGKPNAYSGKTSIVTGRAMPASRPSRRAAMNDRSHATFDLPCDRASRPRPGVGGENSRRENLMRYRPRHGGVAGNKNQPRGDLSDDRTLSRLAMPVRRSARRVLRRASRLRRCRSAPQATLVFSRISSADAARVSMIPRGWKKLPAAAIFYLLPATSGIASASPSREAAGRRRLCLGSRSSACDVGANYGSDREDDSIEIVVSSHGRMLEIIELPRGGARYRHHRA
jgi:hypothetical protein